MFFVICEVLRQVLSRQCCEISLLHWHIPTYINLGIRIQIEKDNIYIFSAPNSQDPESDRNSFAGQFSKLFLDKNTIFGQVVGVKKMSPSL